MHEMSIIREIFDICEERINGQMSNVEKITLRIGLYASVSIHQLKYNFELLKKNTIFNNAILEVKRSKGVRYCSNCNIEYIFTLNNAKCPNCNIQSNNIIKGFEMNIESIEGF